MFRSLQTRLTVSFVATIAATALALGLSLTFLFDRVLQDQYLTTYRNNATGIQVIVEDNLYDILLQRLSLQRVVGVLSDQFGVRIRVYTSATGAPPDDRLVVDSGARRGMSARHLAVDTFAPIAFPVDHGGQHLATLVVSEPLTDRAYRQQQFQQTVALVTLGACLLAAVIGGLLSERLTAPFKTLTRATARIGAGHLSERVIERRRDEAGELARQFNSMAARLEASFAALSSERDRLRQFVADVSHELRTPLTALRTFNELLQDGAGADPDTRRDFLSESGRQIERLDWLTHNLLDLSRLDSGITPVTPRAADLSQTLRRAVESNRPAAESRGIRFALDLQPIVVAQDPPRLEQALSNLVGNAVKFSPAGGTIRVRTYADGDLGIAEVRDEGPGILADELPHVFERFYRGRDANRAGEGSGLGLAIVKAIVSAHHGEVALDSAPGRGATARLSLPLARAATAEDEHGAHVVRA